MNVAAGVERLMERLVEVEVARWITAHSSEIVVHPCNRDGYGVNPTDVHLILSDIAATGWADILFRGVLTDVSAEVEEHVFKSNTALVASSNNLLAEINRSKMKWMSLWGSHTNQGIRCVLDRIQTKDASLAMDGRLSLHRIQQKDAALANVISHGARWLHIPSSFLNKYPGLDRIIQSAGNTTTNISKSEHDLQMLRKIATGVAAGLSFDNVQEAVMRSRPKNLEALLGMYDFTRKFGGGDGMPLLKETEAFIRGQTNSARRVALDFWDALQTDFKGAFQAPRVRHSVLSLLYAHQNPKFVSVSDVKKLASKDCLPRTLACEQELQKMHELIQESSVAHEPMVVQIFGHYQMNMAAFIMDKRTDQVIASMKDHSDQIPEINMGVLGFLCLSAIQAGTGLKLSNCFDAYAPGNKKSEASSSVGACIVARTGTADVTGQLMAELGFSIGDFIMEKKKPDGVRRVAGFSEGKIQLLSEHGAPSVADLESFQRKEWKFAGIVEPEWIDSWVDHSPEQSQDYVHSYVKSMAVAAIYQQVHARQAGLSGLRVSIKPKMVEATRGFVKHELTIGPATMSISIREASEEVPVIYKNKECFLGEFVYEGKTMLVFASSAFVAPGKKKTGFVCPFWLLQTTDREEDANVGLTVNLLKNKINIAGRNDFKVPMVRNTRPINKGEKLVLCVPVPDTKEDGSATSAGKKQKSTTENDAAAPAAKKKRPVPARVLVDRLK